MSMTKPEDIPQRVWDEACECVPDYVKTTIKECIARAILAAEKREREACEALCNIAKAQCREARDKYPFGSELRVSNHAAMTLADDLAEAIRNRNGE